jgi:hypothetical protein
MRKRNRLTYQNGSTMLDSCLTTNSRYQLSKDSQSIFLANSNKIVSARVADPGGYG